MKIPDKNTQLHLTIEKEQKRQVPQTDRSLSTLDKKTCFRRHKGFPPRLSVSVTNWLAGDTLWGEEQPFSKCSNAIDSWAICSRKRLPYWWGGDDLPWAEMTQNWRNLGAKAANGGDLSLEEVVIRVAAAVCKQVHNPPWCTLSENLPTGGRFLDAPSIRIVSLLDFTRKELQ